MVGFVAEGCAPADEESECPSSIRLDNDGWMKGRGMCRSGLLGVR
jgi:hypothetical protein